MDKPITCTLSAARYAARKDDTAAIARDALRSREAVGGGARLITGPELAEPIIAELFA
jgi:hypothetical protein